ncbi:MAG TPA: Mu-like prophage major head subunit gpT family protein [Defluviicoccus sp.]|nr:Mu-like prophage major head subunit gpT family protein [Defluviicoccus sp.]
MQINQENLEILFAGFKAAFNEGLGEIENTRDRIATTIRSETSEEHYGWLKGLPNVREWLGDRVVNSFALGDYAIKNRDFELTVSVPANAIRDDKYGVMAPKMRVMGESVSAHREQLVWDLFAAGFTGSCYDGKPFFATDHPVLDKDGTPQPVANTDGGSGAAWFLIDTSRALKPIILQTRQDYDFVALTDKNDQQVFWKNEYVYGVHGRENAGFGFWQVAWGSKQELNETSYGDARAAMMKMTTDYGRKLGLKPRLLVVGPDMEHRALELIKADKVTGGGSNVYRDSVELVVVPWLA